MSDAARHANVAQAFQHLIDRAPHVHDHGQTMSARQLELLAVEMLLPLAQRTRGGESGHEVVEADFAHCHQARVARVARQRLVQAQQVLIVRALDVQRVNAERVGVAAGVRQRPHTFEGARFDGGNDADRYVFCSCPRPHGGDIGRKLGGIQMAVGVDPDRHARIMPEGAGDVDAACSGAAGARRDTV